VEEKKIESERDEDESKQNKKWIESLGFEHLPVEDRTTNEEWLRIVENLHGFAQRNVSEALRKHLDLDFLHENTFSHPK